MQLIFVFDLLLVIFCSMTYGNNKKNFDFHIKIILRIRVNMALSHIIIITSMLLCAQVSALENGLARTPPMGWLAWERFRCNTNCAAYPDNCVGEKLFMEMADVMVSGGWKDAGYKQVNMDDCWMAKQRNSQGEIYADPGRFPSGIKVLADYLHAKDLKLGIYADFGNYTCSGYPGTMGHEKDDAQTFAEWGVDMLKFDGCSSTSDEKKVGYPLMSKELNETGRPIIFSCSWPAEDGHVPPKINFTLMAEICNLWRNYDDIGDNFDDVIKIINWFAENQDVLIPAAGPGHWNDPDMLIGGNFALSPDQAKLQFGMWAMLAAPLFLSADLRAIAPEYVKILQNRQIIQINQDPLGMQGRRVKTSGPFQLWVRPMWGAEQAIAVFSTSTGGDVEHFSFTMAGLGIDKPASKYEIYNIDNEFETKVVGLNDMITVAVNPQGITIYRAKPGTTKIPHFEYEVKEELTFDIL
uniref:alpha-N-acetylgalactosaminidase-like n=1 Tax=Styela clava TaxID=7725 RepID=UPI001939579F|nr:alpha-N-acetylgalactosaminidase-like [Styela clava]